MTHPPSVWQLVHVNTVSVVASIARVAKQHLFIIVRIGTNRTLSAVNALPFIRSNRVSQMGIQLQARRVAGVVARRTNHHVFGYSVRIVQRV